MLDLSPEDLRRRQRRLEEQVIAQLGQEAPPKEPQEPEEDAA